MIELIDGLSANRYNITYMDVYEEIYRMMGHEPGIKEIFYTKQDRLAAANPMCLILVSGRPVGFINLVQEEIDNIKFLDAAIIKKYRNRGIGKEAIQRFRPDLYNAFVVGETLKTNLSANTLGKELGVHVYFGKHNNYYLFQPDRLEEFSRSEEFQELKNRENGRISFVKRLHK